MDNSMFYLLMFLSAIITAFSQILLKKSADKRYKYFIFEYINSYVVCSYACYFGVLLLNVFIFTKVDYRFGVVFNSLPSVFVVIFSKLILRETITKRCLWGNLLVMLGVVVFTLF